MKKYYEAYDKRYRQVHEKGLSWTTEGNTPIVEEMICKYKLNACRMLEIGCGEGRDVRYLLEKGLIRSAGQDNKQDGSAPGFTLFWTDDEENGVFSNWYRSPFTEDDFIYQHVEQYMMAKKAKLFHDAETYTEILKTEAPGKCKELGRTVSPFDSAKWEAVKYEIVKAGNRAKFRQNPELREALLKTGNSILAEASPKDLIWGTGLDRTAAAQTDPQNWPGQNLMGKILTELREEFRGGQS